MSGAKGSRWVLGARSETGYVRMANEDRMGFIRTPHGDVYVVSDGMGGYRGGALAAELTVRTLQEQLAVLPSDPAAIAERLSAAFRAANQAVYERRDPADPETRSMGATGVALVTCGTRALVGHVGDSRAYLVSRGVLRQLTRDHTRVQKMVDAGLLTPAQAVEHPDASMLDRAIGHDATVEVDVSGWITLNRGDMVLLCSDGLCGYVADAEIGRILRAKASPQALADRLVDCALDKGGADNVTVQLVRLGASSGVSWLARLRRPAVVGPTSALASAVVVWGLGAPQFDAAETRSAKLQEELAASRQQVAALEQKTDSLARQLAGAKALAERPASPTPSPPAAAPAAAAKPAPAKPLPVKPAAPKPVARKTTPKPPATPPASGAASAPAATPPEPTASVVAASAPPALPAPAPAASASAASAEASSAAPSAPNANDSPG